MKRRAFLAGLAGAPLEFGVPARAAKVVRLFKSPDGFPNAMEA